MSYISSSKMCINHLYKFAGCGHVESHPRVVVTCEEAEDVRKQGRICPHQPNYHPANGYCAMCTDEKRVAKEKKSGGVN